MTKAPSSITRSTEKDNVVGALEQGGISEGTEIVNSEVPGVGPGRMITRLLKHILQLTAFAS